MSFIYDYMLIMWRLIYSNSAQYDPCDSTDARVKSPVKKKNRINQVCKI